MSNYFNPIYSRIDDYLTDWRANNKLANELIGVRLQYYTDSIGKLFQAELSADALIIIDYAIVELPMCVDLLYFRAICLIEEERIEEAREQFTKYIQVSNNDTLIDKARTILTEI